jgi:hypothetical protein
MFKMKITPKILSNPPAHVSFCSVNPTLYGILHRCINERFQGGFSLDSAHILQLQIADTQSTCNGSSRCKPYLRPF